MAECLDIVVEQVVDTYADLKLLVLEEASSDKEVAEIEKVVISSLCIPEILEDKGSGECVSFEEHPLYFCRGLVGNIVICYRAEFTAIVVHRIARKITDGKVQLFADVAVEPS